MIPVKIAVTEAVRFFEDMFPNAKDIRLEEVELSDEGPWWDVTLSYAAPPTSTSYALASVIGQPERVYKIIRLDREDATVRSMKIRKV